MVDKNLCLINISIFNNYAGSIVFTKEQLTKNYISICVNEIMFREKAHQLNTEK